MDALQEAFANEARELISQLEEGLIALEKDQSDELINAIFRSAHTLKGAAATANCTTITGFTHVLENTLDRLRQHTQALEADLIESLLASVDHLRLLLERELPVESLLVVTFTKAATAELSGRIRERIVETLQILEGGTPGPDPFVPQLLAHLAAAGHAQRAERNAEAAQDQAAGEQADQRLDQALEQAWLRHCGRWGYWRCDFNRHRCVSAGRCGLHGRFLANQGTGRGGWLDGLLALPLADGSGTAASGLASTPGRPCRNW